MYYEVKDSDPTRPHFRLWGLFHSCVAVACRSTHSSSARAGTLTLLPMRTVGRRPPAIISYAVARPTESLLATSSALRRSFEVSVVFSVAIFMLLLYSSISRNTRWKRTLADSAAMVL